VERVATLFPPELSPFSAAMKRLDCPFLVHTAAGTKLPPLRYYNSDIHVASSVLPEFARAAVEPFVVKGTGP